MSAPGGEPEPAFPAGSSYHRGLSKREWFAGQALAGMMASGIGIDISEEQPGRVRAAVCFMLADAMIEAGKP